MGTRTWLVYFKEYQASSLRDSGASQCSKMKIFVVSTLLMMVGAQEPPPPPMPSNVDARSAPWMSGKYEGDIVLTEEQERWMQNSSRHPSERNAVKNWNNLWTTKVIPYKFSSAFSESEKQSMKQWLDEFGKVSCVKVVPWSDQKDYVLIVNEDGCWSYVGRQNGEQKISLEKNGCVWRSTVIHEFLHAAGFWHEQSRLDRDKYIRVALENVPEDARNNFNKVDASYAKDIGNYDYQSVMQYRSTAFSMNGKKTMIRLDGKTDELGQSEDGTFTKDDIFKLKTLYKCSGTGTTTKGPSTKRVCENKHGDDICNMFAEFCTKGELTDWFHENCAKACKKCS